MATTPLYYLNQFFTTTLNVGGGINNSQTTGIVVTSVSGLDISKPGIALLTYTDPLNTANCEWVTYTSINGSNELQGVTRGAEGYSAKSHSNGVAVAFPISESHINNIAAMFNTTGLDAAQISTPSSPDSGRNKLYFKSDGYLYKLNSSGTETSIEAATPSWTTLSDGATIDINLTTNTKYQVTLGGNRTFTISNATTGKVFLLDIIQDGTGSRTVTWFNKSSTFTTSDVNTGTDVLTVNRDISTTTPIKFTSSGAVPTGLTAGTTYYAINSSSTAIKVATSVANAQAGTAIDITATGSGTHTITTEIRGSGGIFNPTLSTGKYRRDRIGFTVIDATNGIYSGQMVDSNF